MVKPTEDLLSVLFRFVLLIFLSIGFVSHASAQEVPWASWVGTPQAQWAYAQRQWLPQSKARIASAQQAIEAQRGFFGGKVAFDIAFPEYSEANLDDPIAVRGLLIVLDEDGAQRAKLRQSALPDLGDVKRSAQIARQYQSELDVLDEVDGYRRRLLLSVRSHLEAHPELSTLQLQPLYKRWDEARDLVIPTDKTNDEQDEALRRAGQAEQEAMRLKRLVNALRMQALTLKKVEWPLDVERERLANFETYEGAMQRVTLLLGFLTAEEQAPLQVELDRIRWEQEERVARRALEQRTQARDRRKENGVEGEDAAKWEETLAQLTQQDSALQAQLDALEAGESAERTVLLLRREVLSVEIEDAKWVLATLLGGGDVDQRANDSQNKTARAQKEAEAAQQAAKSAQGQRTASLLRYRKEALQAATELWQQAKAVEDNLAIRDRESREKLDGFLEEMDRLERTGFLMGGDLNPDQTYVEVRGFLKDLRASSRGHGESLLTAQKERDAVRERVSADLAKVRKERRDADGIGELTVRNERLAAVESWEQALTDQLEAASSYLTVVRKARDNSLRHLYEAQELRKRLSAHVSTEQITLDRADLIQEVGEEIVLVGPGLRAFHAERWSALLELPSRFDDLNFVSRVFSGLFGFLFVMVLWLSGRRYGEALVARASDRFLPDDAPILPADRAALMDSVQRLRVALVDLLASTLFYAFGPQDLPELIFFFLVVFEVALFRALLATYDLVSVEEPSNRPAVIRLGGLAAPLARTTIKAILIWWVSRRIGLNISGDLMNGYAIEQLVRTFFWVWLFGLFTWLLYQWAPIIRTSILRRGRTNWLVRILSAEPKPKVLGVPLALGGVIFLGLVAMWDLTFRLGRSGGRIGRLLGRLSRWQLASGREEGKGQYEPVPQQVLRVLLERDALDDVRRNRDACVDMMNEAVEEWRGEGRRGLLAVLADTGGGKQIAVDLLSKRWRERGDTIRRIEFEGRLRDRASLYLWMEEMFGLPKRPSQAQEATDLMEATVPEGIYILENAHRAFLRAVGGFDAFRELVNILNATSTKRCWILVMHAPAWQYLSRLGDLINLSVFRAVRHLDGFDEDALRELCVGRIKSMGYRLDFTDIVRLNVLGADQGVELERAIAVFFRLLREASGGNPQIALSLWARCLGKSGERQLSVHLGEALDLRPMSGLTEQEMFALVALRTQEVLTEDELAEVTNMSRTQIRGTVKHLVSIGVLNRTPQGVAVVVAMIPVIDITLRRRRFMHGAA